MLALRAVVEKGRENVSCPVVEVLKPQGFKEHEVRRSGQNVKDCKDTRKGVFYVLHTVDKGGRGKRIFPAWGDRATERGQEGGSLIESEATISGRKDKKRLQAFSFCLLRKEKGKRLIWAFFGIWG